jgi:hypothetical protein
MKRFKMEILDNVFLVDFSIYHEKVVVCRLHKIDEWGDIVDTYKARSVCDNEDVFDPQEGRRKALSYCISKFKKQHISEFKRYYDCACSNASYIEDKLITKLAGLERKSKKKTIKSH